MITGDTILVSWPGPPQGIRDTPLAANTANVFVLFTELETEVGGDVVFPADMALEIGLLGCCQLQVHLLK